MSLIKSQKRVADHGEVFTPPWMVEAMLDLVRDETERLDSRFLEPACGSGNFLVRILQRKLAAVELKFGKSASYVLSQNLVHGDALTMLTSDGQAITFAEWGYLGKGRFRRRDSRLDILTKMFVLR